MSSRKKPRGVSRESERGDRRRERGNVMSAGMRRFRKQGLVSKRAREVKVGGDSQMRPQRLPRRSSARRCGSARRLRGMLLRGRGRSLDGLRGCFAADKAVGKRASSADAAYEALRPPQRTSFSVDVCGRADSLGGTLFADEVAKGEERSVEAASHRQGHGKTAEVVASADGAVPLIAEVRPYGFRAWRGK